MSSRILVRLYSSAAPVKKSANTIRKEFLDYFVKDLGHSIVRSSPIVPINDQSLCFINAGMNQFKDIFLGYYEPAVTKVVNSQKCIRVGGKHNDLNSVGNDTFHHTFFEMLGNWSFDDYFKKEACSYAWNLLTNVYGIEKELLYVTYFGGNEKLGLKPDLECKDIWLCLGIPENRIFPCGMEENFWEMGLSGPCGPCTEIHIDHTMTLKNQFKETNKDCKNLTELWNIVFIQYERLATGAIIPLLKHHVDTGMGFERLVALLQGKASNYDTDLFIPLFQMIQRHSKAPEYKGRFGDNDTNGMDYAYRVLADHSRMITVALADGMFPEENQKLRRVLRKSIDICETFFKKDNLLTSLTCTVAETLEEAYPELGRNLSKVQKVILFEQDLYKKLKKTCGKEWTKIVEKRPELSLISDWTAPGLVAGYKDLQSMLQNIQTSVLPSEIAFKLYDTYGLTSATIAELAEVESLAFNEEMLNKELDIIKHRSRVGVQRFSETSYFKSLEKLEKDRKPKTDDLFKYHYKFDGNDYKFPDVESKIIGLLVNGNLIDDMSIDISQNTENEIGIVLDKTSYYAPEGGQAADKGKIYIKNTVFNVNNVKKVKDYVIHFGNFEFGDPNAIINVGNDCTVSIDPQIRIGLMRHHTATHLLNAALNQLMQVVYQRGSTVLNDTLKFQFNSFNDKLTLKNIEMIENLINAVIKANVPVTTRIVNTLQLLAEKDITLLPGETYPQREIRILEINGDKLKSKEPCCGTHVHNTGHLLDFCILDYTSKGTLNRRITATVGPSATLAKKAYENIHSKISQLIDDFQAGKITYDAVKSSVNEMKHQIANKDKILSSYIAKQECLTRLENIRSECWERLKETEKISVLNEITKVINLTELPFLVYRIQQDITALSLHEIISVCPKMPILMISYIGKNLKIRCNIPQEMVTNEFNAKTWMSAASNVLDVKEQPIKGFDPVLVARLYLKNIPEDSVEMLIEKVIDETTQFALRYQEKMKIINTAK